MGVLDKLMFWRKNDYEVDGCFTLPEADLEDMASSSGDQTCLTNPVETDPVETGPVETDQGLEINAD